MITPKLLVVRFSAMGDIVLTSPVVRMLKQQAGAEIHFLTKEMYSDLWISNPYVSKIYTIKKDLHEVLPLLKKENYTAIIDLHANLRTLLLSFYFWKIPTYSVKKGSVLRWFYVKTGLKPAVQKHIVMRYVETIRPFSLTYDGKGLDFYIPENKIEIPKKPYVVFVLGAGHFTKRLPVEKWKELVVAFKAYPIVFIGGKEEIDRGKSLMDASGAEVWNHCGKLKIGESARLLEKAKLIISGDTGMMHIAAALRRPLISIWGGTIPEFGWLPFFPEGMNRNKTIQVAQLSCRPCSRFGRPDCPEKHFRCMYDISVEAIVAQGQILLQNNYA
jgi:ADP-heptose:LPS heptosyltransferase